MINAALALVGPIRSLIAEVETRARNAAGGKVSNDDQGQMMCRFSNGAMGSNAFSRIATGRKMGYAYEITGHEGRDPLRPGGPERAAGSYLNGRAGSAPCGGSARS